MVTTLYLLLESSLIALAWFAFNGLEGRKHSARKLFTLHCHIRGNLQEFMSTRQQGRTWIGVLNQVAFGKKNNSKFNGAFKTPFEMDYTIIICQYVKYWSTARVGPWNFAPPCLYYYNFKHLGQVIHCNLGR